MFYIREKDTKKFADILALKYIELSASVNTVFLNAKDDSESVKSSMLLILKNE